MSAARTRLFAHTLLAVCLAACVWAVAIATTGGFATSLSGVRISSRNPWTPVALAVAAGAVFALLYWRASTRGAATDAASWWRTKLRIVITHSSRTVLVAPPLVLAVVLSGVDAVQWWRGPPLWLDEQMIALNVRDRSFAELTGALWLGQSAPLGWLVVERVVLLTLGSGELALRLIPFLFGIATLFAAAWIGQRWLGTFAGMLLVLICWIAEWLSHFRFELKHYSADVFWALLLPALAAWVVDRAATSEQTQRRWTIWWVAAAVGQLFSNGALLVTPACALVLLAILLRRSGVRAAARFAVTGGLWLVAFAAHYELSLKFTHHNPYLRNYWANEIPPAESDALARLWWIAARLPRLSENPGGAAHGLLLWGAATAGFLLTRHRDLALMFATVPVSAVVLAALRLVPLYERFSVWIVPALFVGVALLLNRGLRAFSGGAVAATAARAAVQVAAVAVSIIVSADIWRSGYPALDLGPPRNSNHGLDDRSSVGWLLERAAPGDAILTTRLGWPAIWWYGDIPIRRPLRGGELRPDVVAYQVTHEAPGANCASYEDFFRTHRRALVYVGFPDMPDGFYDLLLSEMTRSGMIVDHRRFAGRSNLLVIERRPVGAADQQAGNAAPQPDALEGCTTLGRPRRW